VLFKKVIGEGSAAVKLSRQFEVRF
jgi:hypothetical protein